MNLSLKEVKLTFRGVNIRFSWCSAHVGIRDNELTDVCAKSAGRDGICVNNLVSFKEIICFLRDKYKAINSLFIDKVNQGTGSYYMNHFREINVKFVENLVYKRRGFTTLLRILTGYVNTFNRLFRMDLVKSPICKCGLSSQDLNHLFWACPILDNQRTKLLWSLKIYKLQSPFSVEYLLGNINKRIASIICNFILEIENAFNIKL